MECQCHCAAWAEESTRTAAALSAGALTPWRRRRHAHRSEATIGEHVWNPAPALVSLFQVMAVGRVVGRRLGS